MGFGYGRNGRRNPLDGKEIKAKKQVFRSEQIAHLWAHQTQDGARNAQGNFYFVRETIFSYGSHFPIATHVKGVSGERAILITNQKYSVTTAKQVREVRSAIPPDVPVFEVYTPGNAASSEFDMAHVANRTHALVEISRLVREAKSAKGRKGSLCVQAHRAVMELEAYCAFFGLELPTAEELPKIPLELRAAHDEVTKQYQALNAKREERHRKERVQREAAEAAWFAETEERQQWKREGLSKWEAESRERSKGYEEKLELWLQGRNVSLYDGYFGIRARETQLRVIGDQVETTRGASFPLSHARKGYALVKAVVARGEGWERNGHTCHLGHYQIDRIDADGTVYAGCHVVTLGAIERIADSLVGGE